MSAKNGRSIRQKGEKERGEVELIEGRKKGKKKKESAEGRWKKGSLPAGNKRKKKRSHREKLVLSGHRQGREMGKDQRGLTWTARHLLEKGSA